jgi:hypothetical protein
VARSKYGINTSCHQIIFSLFGGSTLKVYVVLPIIILSFSNFLVRIRRIGIVLTDLFRSTEVSYVEDLAPWYGMLQRFKLPSIKFINLGRFRSGYHLLEITNTYLSAVST